MLLNIWARVIAGSRRVNDCLNLNHHVERKRDIEPVELPAFGEIKNRYHTCRTPVAFSTSDSTGNTQQNQLPMGNEGLECNVSRDSMSQYSIVRRPVARSAQPDGHPLSLAPGDQLNEVGIARLPYPMMSPSMNAGRDHSVLDVMSIEGLLAPEAQSKRPSTSPNRNTYTNFNKEVETTMPPEPTGRSYKEWIPLMLRKTAAFSLAMVLFALVGILRFLDLLEKRRYYFSSSCHA